MPSDANIFQSYLRAPKSVMDYQTDYDQAAARKNALQLSAMDLSEKTQANERTKKVRNALEMLGANTTDEARINALKATATPEGFSQADALEKTIQERAKTKAVTGKDIADTDAKKLESSIKAHDFHLQQLGGVNDPEAAKAWAIDGLQSGVFTKEQFARGFQNIPTDPAQFAQWKATAMQGGVTATEQLKQAQAKLIADNNNKTQITTTGMNNATSRANNTATIGAENERARLTREAGKLSYDSERGGVVNLSTGEFKPATQGGQALGPKDKPLNDSQAKANLFGTRMQEADKVLADMAAKGVKRPGVVKGVAETLGNIAGLGTESMGGALSDAAGSLTNFTQSAEQQQVEQAQRDFINAALRRESGASISPSEFRNANKQYFPQPNDDDATLALKARNRQLATHGILAEVPEGKRTKPAAVAPQGQWESDKEKRYQEWKARQGK